VDEVLCLSKGTPTRKSGALSFDAFEPKIAGLSTSPDYPGASWKGSPNYWQARSGQSVVAIVDHIMQSSIESAHSWFHNTASEVSAHFGVAKDGRVFQWVKVDSAAWANGIVDKPDSALGWLTSAKARGININDLTVSIEHEGYSGQAFPEKQYQATLDLHKWLLKRFNIPLSSLYIIGHGQVDSVNRPNCPGTGFPMARLMTALSGMVNSKPAFDPNPKGFSVGSGMLAKLTELNLTAATNEMYFNPGPNQPGLGKMSQLWTSVPGLKLEAYEELDETDKPTGAWDVKALKEL
jgi:N-acetyl-anhydromuramyl-L-alanine amidase AmpD